MQVTLKQFGDLRCRVVRASDAPPTSVVILCHGFGAPGHDLVDLAPALCHLAPGLGEKTIFAFPEAPLELDFGGFGGARAWWHLDLEAIEHAQRSGTPRTLADEEPDGLPIAHALLSDALAQLLDELGLTWSETIIGGFSQGAMLTTDLAIHSTSPLKGLITLSGNLLHASRSLPKIANQSKLDVLMSHGRQDPILPFSGAEALHEAFASAGAEVEFVPFDGGHTIPESVLRRLADKLKTEWLSNP